MTTNVTPESVPACTNCGRSKEIYPLLDAVGDRLRTSPPAWLCEYCGIFAAPIPPEPRADSAATKTDRFVRLATCPATAELAAINEAMYELGERMRAFAAEHNDGCACPFCNHSRTRISQHPTLLDMIGGVAAVVTSAAASMNGERPRTFAEVEAMDRQFGLMGEGETSDRAVSVSYSTDGAG
jgi:hypothetical protein